MNIKNIKHVHIIGVGGIGVSALARLFILRGVVVSGSDSIENDIIENLKTIGVELKKHKDPKNITDDIDLVIYSSAIPEDHIERKVAVQKGVESLSYVDALGVLMRGHYGIAVSGTNGKTTTTAILGKILEEEDRDPTVIVGGKISGWENFRAGSGEIFLVEACEYRRNMLKLRPDMIVLTNVEEDHLDYYEGIDDIKDAFKEYIKNLPRSGVLIYNADDKNLIELCENNTRTAKVSFGMRPSVDLYPKNIELINGVQKFNLMWKGEDIGEFEITLPGTYNLFNALAASATALHIGVHKDVLRRALKNFRGAGRRFELVGRLDKSIIISDYAHHPTSVRGTIDAAREVYPNKKILVVFQPHQKNRTMKLFDDFSKSFNRADEVILSEIYEVAGRNETENEISSKDLVEAVKKQNSKLTVSYASSLNKAEKLIREKQKDFDVILIMGAGDIDEVARRLVG